MPDHAPASQREPSRGDERTPAAAVESVVVMGASAGGVEAIRAVVAGLPANFACPVLVVLHVGPRSPRLLADILTHAGALHARYACDGEPLLPGVVLVGPPDVHLLVEQGRVRLIRGPKENRSRPAIDPLFRSAAWAYGPRVIGVLLSGWLNDGSAGLWAVKSCGGITIVQDPADARFPDMPTNALESMPIDHRLPARDIGPLLAELDCAGAESERRNKAQATSSATVPTTVRLETRMAQMETNEIDAMQQIGKLSPFTCPSCSGALWEVSDTPVLRFRCHTGHAYTADILGAEQAEATEDALYAAVRALEEKGRLARAIAERNRGKRDELARMYEETADQSEGSADSIRQILRRTGG
jgi:two-component system, chemotaxis family, protein-glutamate methylesterase/glutaminase